MKTTYAMDNGLAVYKGLIMRAFAVITLPKTKKSSNK